MKLGKKVWRSHPDQCDHCGSDSEIFTNEGLDDGWGFDGDSMRCVECGCPGQWNVFDEDSAYASWHDEPDCKCEWCIKTLESEAKDDR